MHDFSARLTPSFMEGLLLLVNSISDTALAVEGPGCLRTKMLRVFRNHDLQSNLYDPSGNHRVASNDRGPARVMGSLGPLVSLIRKMTEQLQPGALLVAPFASQQAMGADLDKALREAAVPDSCSCVTLANDGLDGDWLDGWAQALAALARSLPLVATTSPGAVTIVGNSFWRNEGDSMADVQELERLVSGLGLQAVSVWTKGADTGHLARAGASSVVASLPFATEAAAALADRTGATLVPLPLPVGLEATGQFVSKLAAATGQEERAEALIRKESARTIHAVKTALALHSDDINVGVLADPYTAAGLTDCLEQLGFAVPLVGVLRVAGRYSTSEVLSGKRVLVDPSFSTWEEELKVAAVKEEVQVVVGSGLSDVACHKANVELVEIGYPCHLSHFLTPAPLLGYSGVVCLTERIINAYARQLARQQMDVAAGWYGIAEDKSGDNG
jgi:nitrogenase molybdenum-iron protein alpha/beta subunit